jgi:membrane protein DedA with SNARE-associated domain
MAEQAVVQWITDYGYLGIFFLLIFGIVGLPVPDEWLLVLSGYLAFKDVLQLAPTLLIAAVGSAAGLTSSYLLGRSSSNLIVRRCGKWLSLDEEKLVHVQQWFQHLGRWVLVVGPFIPGIRNVMGYAAGVSKLRLPIFMRFAYLGALISSSTFVGFGYFVGRHVNWNYSTFPLLIAVAFAVVFTVSGAPVRIALRIKNKLATAATISADRLAEASSQPACAPKK